MRMMRHRRSPGMQHGGDSNPCTEMLGIGSNREHGLRTGLEQQAVDDTLVGECDIGNLGWQREDHMKVRHRQKFRSAIFQPFP